MYVITNRNLKKSKGLDAFGKTPSQKGPLELRLTEVSRVNGAWQVTEVKDKLSGKEVKTLKEKFNLDIDITQDWHGSLQAACQLYEQARNDKKSILFFVHGYNNDVGDVLATAEQLEKIHGVIVVPFTWPANGGGAISGTISYTSDKADARASEGALNRAVEKIQFYHNLLVSSHKKELQVKAEKKHKNNPEAAHALFSSLISHKCTTTLNLLCHSMGNYVFKKTLLNSESSTSKLVFDNICLVAADTNNYKHSVWVENLDVRKRIYIVINENDFALNASRIKPGDEQKARLGHYIMKLNSDNANYINVTNANLIDNLHSYFIGDAMNNDKLKEMFTSMFTGKAVENLLEYQAENNTYVLIERPGT